MISQEQFLRVFGDAAPFVNRYEAMECIYIRRQLNERIAPSGSFVAYVDARDRWPGGPWALHQLREMAFVYGVPGEA